MAWSRSFPVSLALLTALDPGAWAQATTSLPTIKSNSKAIKILDGDDALHGELVPDLNPDTYVYHPSPKAKTISFITDLDRIDFQVEPGETYDFVILFEGRVYPQRIAPTGPNQARYKGSNSGNESGDVIPFRLEGNAIHVEGRLNGSEILDLIFDTGASICVLSEAGRAKGAKNRDGTENRLEVSGTVIENTPVSFIDYRGGLRADGVLGYNCFLGKVVKIDYEKSEMAVYDKLPSIPESYQKTDLIWRGANTLVEVKLKADGVEAKTLALFDTGSRWSLSLSKSDPFVKKFFDTLPSLGARRSAMASGHRVTSKVVEIPDVTLAGASLRNAQADLEDPGGEQGLPLNIIGNDLLKRFNVVIDYQKSEVHLAPNHLSGSPYNPVFDWRIMYWGAAGLLAAFALALFWYSRRQRTVLSH